MPLNYFLTGSSKPSPIYISSYSSPAREQNRRLQVTEILFWSDTDKKDSDYGVLMELKSLFRNIRVFWVECIYTILNLLFGITILKST